MSKFHVESGHSPGGIDYDAELQRHHEALLRVVDIQRHDRVLDVGCGTGKTTREAARSASAGWALGVDISSSAVERARAIADAEALLNVAFETADAQAHRFQPGHYDLAVSRFGTMFFDDPGVAFANIGRALRPGGRLAMIVWQASELNEWAVAIRGALDADEGRSAPPAAGPNAFSLADRALVSRILDDAGFSEIAFDDVDEPVYYGPDVTTALDWVSGFSTTAAVLKGDDRIAAAHAVDRLREMLAAHTGENGVWLDSPRLDRHRSPTLSRSVTCV